MTSSRLHARPDPGLSLYHLLDPEVLANPYPLYHRLRSEAPVHWDPYLHAWVVTRYDDVVHVFQHYLSARTPNPEQLAAMGMSELGPIAKVMIQQMLFLDPPQHTRVRGLAARAFTPRRVEILRGHIQQITEDLVDDVARKGSMDVIADIGNPLPSIVTTELLGMPTSDWEMLKAWSTDFAEMLGNFQHNPGRTARVLKTVEEMTTYFRDAVRREASHPTEGLVNALTNAEIDGDRFTEEEVVANIIVTMVGGLETTTNLIGNGLLTLLRHPGEMRRLRDDPSLLATAIEELLRYESPSQHTARLAPEDTVLGGQTIRKRQAVIAVMGAANRDPERFPEPDRLDLAREDNRHVAFAWGPHFCFGAPLARIEGHAAFETMLRRLPDMRLDTDELHWRENLGLRGLKALPVAFDSATEE
jgi:cytochrome P450